MMLSVDKLAAGYGPAQVLFDVSFAVGAGEVVTLLGRNGMGKTTTIHTIMGLLMFKYRINDKYYTEVKAAMGVKGYVAV